MNKLSYDLEVQNCLRQNLESLLSVICHPTVDPETRTEANELVKNLIDDLYVSQFDFTEGEED